MRRNKEKTRAYKRARVVEMIARAYAQERANEETRKAERIRKRVWTAKSRSECPGEKGRPRELLNLVDAIDKAREFEDADKGFQYQIFADHGIDRYEMKRRDNEGRLYRRAVIECYRYAITLLETDVHTIKIPVIVPDWTRN